MIVFTSHVRAGETPILVREGFSWAALLFGALYLAVRRAWIAAGLTFAVFLLALALCRVVHDGSPLLGLFVLQGLLCPDLVRWNLQVRGYVPGPVVAAPDRDQALGRLLDARPDLLP